MRYLADLFSCLLEFGKGGAVDMPTATEFFLAVIVPVRFKVVMGRRGEIRPRPNIAGGFVKTRGGGRPDPAFGSYTRLHEDNTRRASSVLKMCGV